MRKTPAKSFPVPVGGAARRWWSNRRQPYAKLAVCCSFGASHFVVSNLFRGLYASQSTDLCSLKRKLMPYTAKVKGDVMIKERLLFEPLESQYVEW